MLVTKYSKEQTNIAVKTDFRFSKRLPYIDNHKLSLILQLILSKQKRNHDHH